MSCGACNNSFFDIIQALATQFAVINGMLGVRSDHTPKRKGPRPAEGDSALGKITVDAKGKPSLVGPRLKKKEALSNGNVQATTSFGSMKAYQKWLEEKRASGIVPIKSKKVGEFDVFVPEAQFCVGFGGSKMLRATALIALNFLAFKWPKLARTGELQNFKCYVKGKLLLKQGEPRSVWFAPTNAPSMPPAKTQFGHQVLIVADPAGSYARVRFFSTFDLCVDFGRLPTDEVEAFLFDINPLEDSPQKNVIQTSPLEYPARLLPPSTDDVSGHVELLRSRRLDLQEKIEAKWWTSNTEGLLDALNSTSSHKMVERTLAIIELLRPHRGYVLWLGRAGVRLLRESAQDEATQFLADCVEELFAPELNEDDGLSELARGTMEEGLFLLASAIARKLEEGPLTDHQLRLFLTGTDGVHVIMTEVLPFVQEHLKKAYLLRQIYPHTSRHEHDEEIP
ncbi:MAG: hypothetical protein FWD46_01875 [Cystobacterineae bacterium]|nr:hypothetical protein [Cystobacterineae bacterium]